MGRPRKNPAEAGYPGKKAAALSGAIDILSQHDSLWDAVQKRFRRYCRVYGFAEVKTPALEDLRLYENFYKTAPKEMPALIQVSLPGSLSALRPGLLPSVLRCYYEHKIFEQSGLSKWCFSGEVFSQTPKGDLNFGYEFGLEVLGNFTHLTEAQVISAVWDFFQSLGLKDICLEINSIGKAECQAAYQETLRDFLAGKKYQLCDACNEHLRGRVLNVFRCGNLDCRSLLADAPTILDFLDEESHRHFTNILEALDELAIPYQLNHLHAGLDGHGKTNFAIKCKHKGESQILGEGGYHEGLMQNLCGKNFCCFGFSGDLLKVRQLAEAAKITVSKEQKSDVFLVPLGDLASKKSLRLFRDLTQGKIAVYDHFGNAGIKNQLKAAENFKAPIALIMGQKEAVEEMVILRDVKSGMQEVISYDKIVEEVKKRLGK